MKNCIHCENEVMYGYTLCRVHLNIHRANIRSQRKFRIRELNTLVIRQFTSEIPEMETFFTDNEWNSRYKFENWTPKYLLMFRSQSSKFKKGC